MFGHHFPQGSGRVDEAERGNEHPSSSLLPRGGEEAVPLTMEAIISAAFT